MSEMQPLTAPPIDRDLSTNTEELLLEIGGKHLKSDLRTREGVPPVHGWDKQMQQEMRPDVQIDLQAHSECLR